MRLIDADAMMKRLKAWDTNDATDKALYNFALNRVLEAPTIKPERKMIPAKPIEKVGEYNENLIYLYCPSCKHGIGIWNDRLKRGDMYNKSNRNICAYCGQAIQLEKESWSL